MPREHRKTSETNSSTDSERSHGFAANLFRIGFTASRKKGDAKASSVQDQFLIEHPPVHTLDEVLHRLDAAGEMEKDLRVGDLALMAPDVLPVLFTGVFPFTARHVATPATIIDTINQNQMIDLELYQEGLRASVWPHIRMGASLRKFVDYRKHGLSDAEDGGIFLRPTSHLGVFLSPAAKSSIELGVFGHVSKTADDLYIKPYAIWLDAI